MAAKTWNVSSGLWSVGSNWSPTGVPVNLDTVTIPAGTACTFDVDQSSWANGLGGLTINGELNFDTTNTKKWLKMAGGINGTGKMYVGTEANPIPAPGSWAGPGDATVTIQFNGNYSITSLSTLEFWGDQRRPGFPIASKPDNYTIVLSTADGDPGDWLRANDIVAISNSTVRGSVSTKHETFIVDSYNPTTRTIILNSSTPLTRAVNQNSDTDYVVLLSHNIKALGNGANTFSNINGVIAAGVFFANNSRALTGTNCRASYCSVWADSGIAAYYGIANGRRSIQSFCAASNITNGSFTGYNRDNIILDSIAVNQGSAFVYFGNNYLIARCHSFNSSYGFVNQCRSVIVIDSISHSCVNNMSYASSDCIFINCDSINCGLLYSGGSGPNTYINCGSRSTEPATSCCNLDSDNYFKDCIFHGTESLNSGDYQLQGNIYAESINHNLTGIYKAWSPGGITISQSTTVPPDKLIAYQSNCASSTYWTYVREELQLLPGQKLNVWGAIKLSATGFTNGPVFELVDKDQDPLNLDTYSALDTWTASNATTDWQYANLSYEHTGTYPITIYIRCRAIDASKTFYSAWDYQVIDESTKALLPQRYFYNQPTWSPSLKLALLTGYTYNSNHKTWSDVSSYEITPTGDYVAGGVSLTATFSNGVLSINSTSIYLVSANVSHMVIYDTYRNNLITAIKFPSSLSISNDYLTVDFSSEMLALILNRLVGASGGLYIEIEL